MPLQFLPDPRFYTDYDYCMSHFNWAAAPQTALQPLIYHGYWGGKLTQHHALCLKSLLVTQSPPFEIWVWMYPQDIWRNKNFITQFKDVACLRWKVYLYSLEAWGTPFPWRRRTNHDRDWLNVADTLRLLALWKYGGLYFDFDMLFLKDLRPLCNVDFCYQWATRPFANNAILHACPRSQNIQRLIERALTIDQVHPKYLLNFAEIASLVENLYVWPTFLFDPAWIAHDTRVPINTYCNRFADFFTNESMIRLGEFFPGAYTYHWHNAWDTPIRPTALAGQLLTEIEARFRATHYGKGTLYDAH